MFFFFYKQRCNTKINFTLSEKHYFKYYALRNFFFGKNIIHYEKIICKEPIPIESTRMINIQQLRNWMQHIKEIDRPKITYSSNSKKHFQ